MTGVCACEDLCTCRWEEHVKSIRRTRGPLSSSWSQNTRSHDVSFPTPNFDQTVRWRYGSLVWLKHTCRRVYALEGNSWMQGILYPETHTHTAELYSPPSLLPSRLQSNQLLSNPIRPTEAFHLESSSRVDYARWRRGMDRSVSASAHLHRRCARLCWLRCTACVCT